MKLHTQIFIALGLGVLIGVYLPTVAGWLTPVGQAFLLALKMIIAPLILASMVTGVTHLKQLADLGRLGVRAAGYYVITTLVAVLLGLAMVNLIKPGVGAQIGGTAVPSVLMTAAQDGGFLQNLLPSLLANPFAALAATNVLGLIVFGILLGMGIVAVGEPAAGLRQLFDGLYEVMKRLTGWIMKAAPLGLLALVSGVVMASGLEVFVTLGKYMVTVVLGLAIHSVVILPLILRLIGRRPTQYASGMRPALGVAFGTASSAATLPVTLESTVKNNGVREPVANFVLPLGATINMDGTALYEAVAALFIAQAYGISLSIGQQVLVVATATLASIGAAAIPSAGLITMGMVLQAVGLPLEGIGLILIVDRPLDMCRTTVNVWGDSVGAAVVDHWTTRT